MSNIITGYRKPGGEDLGANLVDKSYLIDRYPELANSFKQAGLWLWGRNGNGQLGNNATTRVSSPVQTISGGANWRQVASSSYNTITNACIKTDGTLWLWGAGDFGVLGNNATTSRSSPVQTVSGGTNWKDVSITAGNFGLLPYAAAIKTDGRLWLWGAGDTGVLGNNATTSRSSPVQTVSGGTNWKQVSCGLLHCGAVKTNGQLWLWGSNGSGILGNGSSGDPVSSPIQTVSGGTNWKQVSCGFTHTAAVKTDGTLWLWGSNNIGQLGNNSTTTFGVLSPIQTVSGGTNWKQVSVGEDYTGAIKTDGTLWLWGLNQNGALGNNSTLRVSSPVQTISGGTNWKQVSVGVFSGAIKTDGTLWVWGLNSDGQLGNNNTTRISSPVQTVSGGTNWVQIMCGSSVSMAIRDMSNDYL